MFIPTVVMVVLALVLLAIGYARGEGEHLKGLRSALAMLGRVLPLLLCAFVVGSMVQILVPREAIAKWIGAESGCRGILMGTLAGGFAPGGPYVSLPFAAGLVSSGAGVGTMVAFLTSWSLWAFARLPLEIGVLGWRLTLARLASTFFFPPIAGLLAHLLFRRWAAGV